MADRGAERTGVQRSWWSRCYLIQEEMHSLEMLAQSQLETPRLRHPDD